MRQAFNWLRDAYEDIRIGVRGRPVRAATFMISSALAIGIFVFSAITATTTASAVSDRFDQIAPDLMVTTLPLGPGATFEAPSRLTLAGLEEIEGVEGAAALMQSSGQAKVVNLVDEPPEIVTIFSAVGNLETLGLATAGGRPVASPGLYVGAGLAGTLGIGAGSLVIVDGKPNAVIGLLVESTADPNVLLGMLLVEPSMQSLSGEGAIYVGIRKGWARHLDQQTANMLSPTNPGAVFVQYPPEADFLRTDIVGSVDFLALVSSAVILAMGSLWIAIATLVRVMDERRMYGLRLTLGEKRSGVLFRGLVESGAFTLFGGVLGTILAIAVSSFALSEQVVRIPWGLCVIGIVVAFALNAVAATAPAAYILRANPVDLLRSR